MLPRVATQVTVPTPSPEPTTDGGPRPVYSTEALRAAVVLRLLEAMMRQTGQHGGKGNVAHQLLDILFAAMKTMPPGDGKDNEPSRRLANLLSRLPAEMRPSIERLLTSALSTVSTRVLMEIIRNPAGRDAQRLAQVLLATKPSDVGRSVSMANARFASLAAQLAAPLKNLRPDMLSSAMNSGAGDAGASQAALRRLFEGDANGRLGPATTAAASRAPAQISAIPAAAGVQGSAEGARRAAGGMNDDQSRLDIEAENDDQPIGKARAMGNSREGTAIGASGQAPAHEARATQESMQRLIAGIVSNLTEDEALVLRLLLEAPLPEAPTGAGEQTLPPDRSADEATAGQPATDTEPDVPGGTAESERAGPRSSRSEAAGSDAGTSAALVSPREDESVEALQPRAEQGDKSARIAANVAPRSDWPVERLPMPPVMREGIGFPIVPHQPAQDDFDSGETRSRDETNEEETSDTAGDNESDSGNEEPDDEDRQMEQAADADPDLAHRRRKMEEHVGPPDPGFAFYQRLGDYWT